MYGRLTPVGYQNSSVGFGDAGLGDEGLGLLDAVLVLGTSSA
jgi:hypothetical protein